MPAPANPYTARVRRLAHLRQGLALALILAAVALGAVYWWHGRAEHRAERGRPELKAPVLGLDIQQSASGVTVAKSEGGRPVFRISAHSAEKLRSDGQEILHQVDVQIYDRHGAPADQIHGDAFAYDASSGELTAQGAVHVVLTGHAAPVHLDARDLAYNIKDGTGSILRGVIFTTAAAAATAAPKGTNAASHASGTAATVELDSKAGVAVLGGGVAIRWQRAGRPDLDVHSSEATLLRQPAGDVITLDGSPQVVAGPQSLDARQLILHLAPDQQLREIDALGDVRAHDTSSGRELSAQANAAVAGVAQEGLTALSLSGNTLLTQTAASGRSSLAAGEVQFIYARAGQLQRVEARRSAVLTVAGREPERVTAPGLDFDLAPGARRTGAARGTSALQLASVHTHGRATLQRGTVFAEADAVDLTLDARQQPASARARGDVRVRQMVPAGVRTSRSGELDLAFAGGELSRAVERGEVTLVEPGPAGGRTLQADAATYVPATFTTVLEGHVRARDAQANLTADRAVYVDRPRAPTDLSAAGAVTLSALVPARGLSPQAAAAPPSATPVAGAMLQPSQPLVITAASLHWVGEAAQAVSTAAVRSLAAPRGTLSGVATFDGGVRLLQAPNLLRADHLVLDAGARTVAASGGVTTDFVTGNPPAQRAVTIAAQTLIYGDAERHADYRGHVVLQSADTTLAAPELVVSFTSGDHPQLDQGTASGGVRITQPGRTARADRVGYAFGLGRIEMTGGSPSILDAERGEIRGDRLTFYVASDEIQVEGKPGARAQGRVIGHK